MKCINIGICIWIINWNRELLPTTGIRAGLSAITPAASLPGILLAIPLPDCSISLPVESHANSFMIEFVCWGNPNPYQRFVCVFFCISLRLLRLSILVTAYFLCHSINFWRLPAWRLQPCLKAATCDCFEVCVVLETAHNWRLRTTLIYCDICWEPAWTLILLKYW